jgi:hypothetical protein
VHRGFESVDVVRVDTVAEVCVGDRSGRCRVVAEQLVVERRPGDLAGAHVPVEHAELAGIEGQLQAFGVGAQLGGRPFAHRDVAVDREDRGAALPAEATRARFDR